MKTRKYVIALAIALIALLGCEEKETGYDYTALRVTLSSPENGAIITSPNEMILSYKLWDRVPDANVNTTLYYSEDTINWLKAKYSPYLPTEYYQEGKKIYWKVEAQYVNSNLALEDELDYSVVSSPIRYFFTSPQGVSELQASSGHEFTTLTWVDPENVSSVEITYQDEDGVESDSVRIPAGEQVKIFTNLTNDVIYTFNIKVIDQNGNSSKADVIKSLPLISTQIHDVEFNVYNTFVLNYSDGTSATWMQENLRTTKYRTGEDIPVDRLYHSLYMQAATIHIDDESNEVYYSGDILKDKLYNNGGGRVCPSGYHVSTDEDWKALERHLGIPDAELDSTNSSFEADLFDRGVGSGAAYQLMTDADWKNGKASFANYIIPFFAKPVGLIGARNGEIQGKGKMCMFIIPEGYRSRLFHEDTDAINRYYKVYEATFGGSIRCVKDK